jgi:hypothetical protein
VPQRDPKATDHDLDHVVINVGSDLDAAATVLGKMGFVVSERGHHSIGTANHIVVFDDTYLELIGLPADFAGPAPIWLVAPPRGLKALALKAQDARDLKRALQRRGIATLDVLDVGRPISLDDSAAIARFRVLQLRDQPASATAFFWCEHETPELVWRTAARKHLNLVQEIASIEIFAARADASATACSELLGKETSAGRIGLGPCTLNLLEAGPNAEPRAALTLRVGAMDAVVDCLRRGGLKWVAESPDRISIETSVLGGLTLRFERSAA